MRLTRVLGVAVVLLTAACLAQADDAAKAKGKGKKKAHGVHGVVVEVKKDKDKDEGTFTAKVGGKSAGYRSGPATARKRRERTTCTI